VLEPRRAIRNIPAYHPPLGDRVGLRLDFNENPSGCSPRVLARLRQLTAEQLGQYPDRAPVETVTAHFLGVDPGELILTNGVDEAIHLVAETYLEPDDEVLIPVPTFSMYAVYAAATDARTISIPTDSNFTFPLAALLARITPRTRLITLANPNNPTGAIIAPDDLVRVLIAAPHAAVLVDEAYFEFSGQTLLPRRREFPNLLVARTFSKAYGLAGLRIGVLIAAAIHMEMICRVSSPYNVNAAALACIPEALADQDYVRTYVAEVLRGRDLLAAELRAANIPFWPSSANFLLARFADRTAAFLAAMKRRGILLRNRSSDPGCDGCVRITLGSLAHTERLLAALRESLAELGTVAETR
jgi:histidinol-phosphate aminotransferase